MPRLFPLLLLVACASEEDVQAQWQEFLADHRACEVDEDCVLVYPGCPLGCYDTVAAEHAEEAEETADRLIRRYETFGRSCSYDCIAAPDPFCAAGTCALPE